MYLVSHKAEECCGCGACVEICPRKCIKMTQDREGFAVPVVRTEACANCGLCKSVCPNECKEFSSVENIRAYVGTNEEEIVYKSASGGAFTAIYECCISKGYIVYGAKFDENLKVVHRSAQSASACESFRKSKYVQSDMCGCYREIAAYLKQGRSVLFSGTPCQCAALSGYLHAAKAETKNLYLISILCHGVPNQALFDSYIQELSAAQKELGGVQGYTFKSKEPIHGKVNSRSAQVTFANGDTVCVDRTTDPYLNAYYSRLFLRPSCGSCLFARSERVSDVTIADAWGIEKILPSFDPLKGVSLVLTHSEKGEALLAAMRQQMELQEIDAQWALKSQALFHKPTWMHENRKKFFLLWEKGKGFSFSVQKALHTSFFKRCFYKAKAIMRNLSGMK